jgi:hypothetical protein
LDISYVLWPSTRVHYIMRSPPYDTTVYKRSRRISRQVILHSYYFGSTLSISLQGHLKSRRSRKICDPIALYFTGICMETNLCRNRFQENPWPHLTETWEEGSCKKLTLRIRCWHLLPPVLALTHNALWIGNIRVKTTRKQVVNKSLSHSDIVL